MFFYRLRLGLPPKKTKPSEKVEGARTILSLLTPGSTARCAFIARSELVDHPSQDAVNDGLPLPVVLGRGPKTEEGAKALVE